MAKIKRYEAKDGTVSYTTRVYSHRDERGQQKFKWITAPTRREVEREVRRLEDTKDKGTPIAIPRKLRKSFAAYLDQWLKVKAVELEPKPRREYRGMARRYIFDPPKSTPEIGSIPLQRLTVDHFNELYAWLYTEHVT